MSEDELDRPPRKLSTIGAGAITPEVLMHTLLEDLPYIEQAFTMVLTKDGRWLLYASGNIYEMITAAAIMKDMALGGIRGEDRLS